MRTEDGTIVRLCLEGDTESFGLLVDKYKASVFALALTKVGNLHDAEDITQEVFVTAYRKLHQLRHWECVLVWLRTITRNRCRNLHRTQTRRRDKLTQDGLQQEMFHSLSIDAFHSSQLEKVVRESISSLPEQYAEVVSLYYLGGLSTREIAKLHCTKPNTIAKRLQYARSLLRKELQEVLETPVRFRAGFTPRLLESVKSIPVRPSTPMLPFSVAASVLALLLHIGMSGFIQNIGRSPDRLDDSTLSVMLLEETTYPTSLPRIVAEADGDTPNQPADSTDRNASSETAMLRASWQRFSGNPILTQGAPGTWDSGGIDHPTVIHDGLYRMYYNGYNEGHHRIGLASSLDGTTWTKYEGNPVLDIGEPGEWDDHTVANAMVIYDGAYRMWYSGHDGTTYRVGLATSDNGLHWMKHPANPILDVTPGDWDGLHVHAPCVVFDGRRYLMWYAGSSGPHEQIGVATSHDGVSWQKHRANPVIGTGPDRSWDGYLATAPWGRYEDGLYTLWYAGCEGYRGAVRVGVATSVDGLHWRKHAENPVFDTGSNGSWDGYRVSVPTIYSDGMQAMVWYAGTGEESGTAIGVAVNQEGL